MTVVKRFNSERLPGSRSPLKKRHVTINARVLQGQASRKPKITMPTFKFSGDKE